MAIWTIYVAKWGNDSNDGRSKEQALRTFEGARLRAIALHAALGTDPGSQVLVQPGVYNKAESQCTALINVNNLEFRGDGLVVVDWEGASVSVDIGPIWTNISSVGTAIRNLVIKNFTEANNGINRLSSLTLENLLFINVSQTKRGAWCNYQAQTIAKRIVCIGCNRIFGTSTSSAQTFENVSFYNTTDRIFGGAEGGAQNYQPGPGSKFLNFVVSEGGPNGLGAFHTQSHFDNVSPFDFGVLFHTTTSTTLLSIGGGATYTILDGQDGTLAAAEAGQFGNIVADDPEPIDINSGFAHPPPGNAALSAGRFGIGAGALGPGFAMSSTTRPGPWLDTTTKTPNPTVNPITDRSGITVPAVNQLKDTVNFSTSLPTDYYQGATIRITTGPGTFVAGADITGNASTTESYIESYDPVTQTITLGKDWSINPDAVTTVYEIIGTATYTSISLDSAGAILSVNDSIRSGQFVSGPFDIGSVVKLNNVLINAIERSLGRRVADDQFEESIDTNTLSGVLSAGTLGNQNFLAQKFVPQQNMRLRNIELALQATGLPVGTMTVEIQTESASLPSNTILTEQTFNVVGTLGEGQVPTVAQVQAGTSPFVPFDMRIEAEAAVIGADAAIGATQVSLNAAVYTAIAVGDYVKFTDISSGDVEFRTVRSKDGSPLVTLDVPLEFDYVASDSDTADRYIMADLISGTAYWIVLKTDRDDVVTNFVEWLIADTAENAYFSGLFAESDNSAVPIWTSDVNQDGMFKVITEDFDAYAFTMGLRTSQTADPTGASLVQVSRGALPNIKLRSFIAELNLTKVQK